MNTTEVTAVSDSASKRVDGLGLSRCAYHHAHSLTEEILMRSEASLSEHFAACSEQEAQFFGVSSEYHLEVKHLGENQGGSEVIPILSGSSPIPQVVERFAASVGIWASGYRPDSGCAPSSSPSAPRVTGPSASLGRTSTAGKRSRKPRWPPTPMNSTTGYPSN